MNGCFFQQLLRQSLSWFLSFENAFSYSFHFKPNRKSIDSLHLRDRHVFMWQSVKVLNIFNILTLIQVFWKTKTFFKKLEYRFLVETTKTENTSISFETALSETNVRTNKMTTTKWTYHKEESFASNYFIFLEILFQF